MNCFIECLYRNFVIYMNKTVWLMLDTHKYINIFMAFYLDIKFQVQVHKFYTSQSTWLLIHEIAI